MTLKLKVFMGQVWTLYQTSVESGLAMSASSALQTLPWSNELIRKSVWMLSHGLSSGTHINQVLQWR
ncbi:MAG: hypothetical protein WCG11_09000 [Methylococcaceae bacterium]